MMIPKVIVSFTFVFVITVLLFLSTVTVVSSTLQPTELELKVTVPDNPTPEWYERRIWELEQQLYVYQRAEGIIVIRDNGACAREWWDAGVELECGQAWGRFRTPYGKTFELYRGE